MNLRLAVHGGGDGVGGCCVGGSFDDLSVCDDVENVDFDEKQIFALENDVEEMIVVK